MSIPAKDFALAVVSGNPAKGNSPEEIAEEAVKIYIAALKVAQKHNDETPVPRATISKKPTWIP